MSHPSFLFDDTSLFANRRIHLSVTGSVACYKTCDLVRAFRRLGMHVSVTLSYGALSFVQPLLFEALGAIPVYSDAAKHKEGPFAHLEPGETAECMLIAPLSANMLAKLANGMACDLVSTQALAFSGPLLLAPAMNPKMWHHPAVQANLAKLTERGAFCVYPGSGVMACGDVGQGKLACVEELVWAVLRSLAPQDMAHKKVLVTLGSTREYWDDVRFLSNPSSGRMGCSLALSAWLRGATVHMLCGEHIAFSLPSGIIRHSVTSATEMFQCAKELWPEMDYGMFSAAVADFAPEKVSGKIKKTECQDTMTLTLHRNPDILASLANEARAHQKILAFAAETTDSMADLLPLAKEKCARKGATLLCANRVNAKDSGFVSAKNTVLMVNNHGLELYLPTMNKSDLAWRLSSCLLEQ